MNLFSPQMRSVLREGITQSRHGRKTTRLVGVSVIFEDNEVWGLNVGIGGYYGLY